jgi:hypothetical protein
MIWDERKKPQNADELVKHIEEISKAQRKRMKQQIQDNPHVNEMGDLLEWEN